MSQFPTKLLVPTVRLVTRNDMLKAVKNSHETYFRKSKMGNGVWCYLVSFFTSCLQNIVYKKLIIIKINFFLQKLSRFH